MIDNQISDIDYGAYNRRQSLAISFNSLIMDIKTSENVIDRFVNFIHNEAKGSGRSDILEMLYFHVTGR